MRQRFIAIVIGLMLAFPLGVYAVSPTNSSHEQPVRGLSSLNGGVQGFLERRNSALATITIDNQSAGQIIENISAYYTVEPRIMLALLETTSGMITAQTLPVTATDQPFDTGTQGFVNQIDWAAREIRIGFGPYDAPIVLDFANGTRRTLDPTNEDAHALTVKRFLAFGRTQAAWEHLIARYPVVYDQLFRDEPIASPPSPPANSGFLSEPWLPGTNVIHSSYFDHTYPMVDSGGDNNDVMTNYLGRSGLSYNSHDGHDYYFPDKPYGTPIVAAAPGWAYARTTRGLGVLIQHTGEAAGYESVYWHLEAFAPSFKDIIDSAKPRWVERGELLGWSGATGFTDGAPHLHFEIRHNGKQVDPYGWYGSGSDPCANYVKCEPSVWLWNDSVSWSRPDAPAKPDTTPPQALLTLQPASDIHLLAQFDDTVLSGIGAVPSSENLSFEAGKWGKAVRVGVGDSLTYPASPTLNLEHGTVTLWLNVPETWITTHNGRHYMLAASSNPADPAEIYSNTLALRHEQRDGDPVWTFWTVDDAGVQHELSTPDTLQAGWHHFAISWDATTGTKTMFIDGVQTAQASGVALPNHVGERLEVGRWSIGGGSNLVFDELSSVDHVLSNSDVWALAKAESAQNASSSHTTNNDLLILTPALDNDGGIVKAQLGINGVFAAPMPYYRAYSWTLPAAEKTYTVSLRLSDRHGNTSTFSQTIMLDQAPQANVGLLNANDVSATLAISATDANMPLDMALSHYANPTIKMWEPLQAQRIWEWSPLSPHRVYVWVRDAHGNEQGPFVVGTDMWRVYLPRVER